MKNKLFTLFLTLVTSIGTMFAYDAGIGGLYYYLDSNNKTAKVTYKSLGDYSGVYNYNWNIKTANIPSSVTCDGITYTVTSIGGSAFSNCTSLTSVTIPNSVTSIEYSAFYGCTSLTSIIIGDSVTSIGNDAFNKCTSLTYITIPSSVTSIGKSAFRGTNLTFIEIPNSVSNIGDYTFYDCSRLTSITIPNSVTRVGSSAFYGCNKLHEIHYIGDIEQWCSKTWYPSSISSSYELYINEEKESDIVLPNSVTSIGSSAFYGCTSLTSVIIGDSVTSIGSSAFYGCTSLTSVIIGDSVTSIGGYAFDRCYNLTSITLPESVTSIGEYAFHGCYGLTEIFVPCGELNRFKEMLINDSRVKYVPLDYKISILPSDYGTVETPTICDDTILTAFPNYGYHFSQWSDGNTDNPRKIILTQDTTFSATFSPNKYSISDGSDATQGHIEGTGSFDYLTENSVTAIPNYGYHLVKWSDMVDSVYNVDEIPSNAISLTKAREIASGLSSWGSTSQKYTIYGYITDLYPGYSNSYIISENPDNGVSFVIFKAANSANIGDFVYVTAYLYNYKGTLETEQGGVITKISKKYVIPSNPRTIVLDRDTIIEAVFAPNKYVIQGNTDISRGHIEGTGSFDYLSNQTLTAVNEHGYCFKQWSDGNTDNPRTIVLTKDTVFTAIFDYATTGYCGDDYALTWVYNREDKALTISGTGKLNSNYDFGLEAPSEVEKLIIEDGVTTIGEAAFKNYTTLTSVSVATSVKTIYEQAFYNCLNLQNFYCFREYPSVVYNNTFEGVDKFECTLHVPSTSIDMYKAATGWRDFYFIIGNSDTSTSVDYTSADQSKATKILRDGQILILRGNKVYTVTGQEVR